MQSKPRVSVFVSSTITDLVDHRAAVRDAILKLGYYPIMAEYFSPDGEESANVCRKKVDEADVYVGILAHRYGTCPEDSDLSITEMEFNRARDRRIPRLCFVIDENMEWPHELKEDEPGRSKLRTFKERLDASVLRGTFTVPDNLAVNVSIALYEWADKARQRSQLERRRQSKRSRYSPDADQIAEIAANKVADKIRGF